MCCTGDLLDPADRILKSLETAPTAPTYTVGTAVTEKSVPPYQPQ